jgi:hypothetical protein
MTQHFFTIKLYKVGCYTNRKNETYIGRLYFPSILELIFSCRTIWRVLVKIPWYINGFCPCYSGPISKFLRKWTWLTSSGQESTPRSVNCSQEAKSHREATIAVVASCTSRAAQERVKKGHREKCPGAYPGPGLLWSFTFDRKNLPC